MPVATIDQNTAFAVTQQSVATPIFGAYNRHMPRSRRILLSLLVVVGLLSTLGWNATAMACPLDSVTAAAPVAHSHGCTHASPPAKPQLPSHPWQLCAACIAVLPRPMQIAANVPPPAARAIAHPHSLSGFDPMLDPPPPRAA